MLRQVWGVEASENRAGAGALSLPLLLHFCLSCFCFCCFSPLRRSRCAHRLAVPTREGAPRSRHTQRLASNRDASSFLAHPAPRSVWRTIARSSTACSLPRSDATTSPRMETAAPAGSRTQSVCSGGLGLASCSAVLVLASLSRRAGQPYGWLHREGRGVHVRVHVGRGALLPAAAAGGRPGGAPVESSSTTPYVPISAGAMT